MKTLQEAERYSARVIACYKKHGVDRAIKALLAHPPKRWEGVLKETWDKYYVVVGETKMKLPLLVEELFRLHYLAEKVGLRDFAEEFAAIKVNGAAKAVYEEALASV